MNIIKKNLAQIVIVFAVILAGSLALFNAHQASASIAVDTSAPTDRYLMYELFASTTAETTIATTTSATSTNIIPYFDSSGRLVSGAADLRGAKRATFFFTRGDTSGQGNTGKSVFRVQVSRDGTNWNDYSYLIGTDVAETATSTVTISAATSTTVVSMDLLKHSFFSARCIVVETTDGEHTCSAAVQY